MNPWVLLAAFVLSATSQLPLEHTDSALAETGCANEASAIPDFLVASGREWIAFARASSEPEPRLRRGRVADAQPHPWGR
jgi:hypothetical protein